MRSRRLNLRYSLTFHTAFAFRDMKTAYYLMMFHLLFQHFLRQTSPDALRQQTLEESLLKDESRAQISGMKYSIVGKEQGSTGLALRCSSYGAKSRSSAHSRGQQSSKASVSYNKKSSEMS